MAAPLPSSTAALLLTSPLRMRLARTTADAVLSTVMAAVRIRLAHLPIVVGRDSRTGLMHDQHDQQQQLHDDQRPARQHGVLHGNRVLDHDDRDDRDQHGPAVLGIAGSQPRRHVVFGVGGEVFGPAGRTPRPGVGRRECLGHQPSVSRHHGGMTDDTTDDVVRRRTESRHVSVWMDVAPEAVYDFASDPTQLPRWAAGLADPALGDADVRVRRRATSSECSTTSCGCRPATRSTTRCG